ncbi:hypothetical protein CDAR_58251 [Caerostris darwini]|uniref:Uncharacterized protein n=1 Tax=Caerostris darwini TaxID=1538125 RepID=A0AAV4U7B1_9ARAC|nr:hypothetical protein CDAR_58251 [Caerostris darwini]
MSSQVNNTQRPYYLQRSTRHRKVLPDDIAAPQKAISVRDTIPALGWEFLPFFTVYLFAVLLSGIHLPRFHYLCLNFICQETEKVISRATPQFWQLKKRSQTDLFRRHASALVTRGMRDVGSARDESNALRLSPTRSLCTGEGEFSHVGKAPNGSGRYLRSKIKKVHSR